MNRPDPYVFDKRSDPIDCIGETIHKYSARLTNVGRGALFDISVGHNDVSVMLILVLVLAGPVLDKSYYLIQHATRILLYWIYLFSIMGFTVICCELSLCVHCCCLTAIVGLAATCSK